MTPGADTSNGISTPDPKALAELAANQLKERDGKDWRIPRA
jgi:hypothetical protein